MKESPFIYNVVAENDKFYGRDEIIREILGYTAKNNDFGNVWLLGQNQVGKTSILKRIQRYNSQNIQISNNRTVKFIYIDCQYFFPKDDFLNYFARQVNYTLSLGVAESESDFFTSVFNQVYLHNIYIVYLFDEFDSIFNHIDDFDIKLSMNIMKTVRSIINGIQHLPNQPKLIGAVFSSRKIYGDVTNGFKNIGSPLNFLKIDIPWFGIEDIQLLVEHYGCANIFTKNDYLFCFRLSKGHPKLVQKTLELIYFNKKHMHNILTEKQISNELLIYSKSSINEIEDLNIPKEIIDSFSSLGIKLKINLLVTSLEFEAKK